MKKKKKRLSQDSLKESADGSNYDYESDFDNASAQNITTRSPLKSVVSSLKDQAQINNLI